MGIFGASKEYVDALDEKQRQVVRGIAKTVELQGTNIARLTGRADGLQRLIVELTEKVVSWGKITSENTRQIGELIDRLSTLSADLAELDKRVSALEEARTQVVFETANLAAKKLPAARGAQYEIGDVHDATGQKPAREPKPDRVRVSTKDVATTIMRIDRDASFIAARARAEFISQRVIDACIAAGVVTALRFNLKHVISVTTHDREDARPNRTRFYASVRPEGEPQARQVWEADEAEIDRVADKMRQFVDITRDYFAKGRKP